MLKYRIILFQPYLRKHIVNFGAYLKHCKFIIKKPSSGNFYHALLPSSYEDEIQRLKTSKINTLRRLLGIVNIRIKFDPEADLFFTYGCLLITNKPYCVYIENGMALYNYDVGLSKNPLAKLYVSWLVQSQKCQALIFMSKAAEKSFYAGVRYSVKTLAALQLKSYQIYPLVEARSGDVKRVSGNLKLLFTGMFYMKGGLELIRAFNLLRQRYSNLELTIVTHLQTIKPSDLSLMKELPGLTILDAKLDAEAMDCLYKIHDIFILPTLRDSFGLVLIEALSYGMPIICTDQFATTEVAKEGYNAFVYPNHPLQDYDPITFQILGKYRNPKDFYADLSRLQQAGKLHGLESFLVASIEQFLENPSLLETFSEHSLELYRTTFHQGVITAQIEKVFLKSINALDRAANPHPPRSKEMDKKELDR